MKYQIIIAAVAASTALATPAFAQDLSGFRIEARAGWERLGVDSTVPNPDYDEDAEEPGDEYLSASDNDTAVTYGFEAGYDFQLSSNFVVGAYGGIDFSDSRSCMELVGDDWACAKLKHTWTAGVRAGVPITETSLVYVKGGYSNGKFGGTYDPDITDNEDDEPGAILDFSDTKSGYHVGAGVEMGLTSKLYAKLEYLYTDYGSRSTALDDDDDARLRSGSDRHQLLAGVGVRF